MSITYRQLIASLLLVLFSVVHAGKLSHTHAAPNQLLKVATKALVEKEAGCAVCEYLFVPDADNHHSAVADFCSVLVTAKPSLLFASPVSSVGLLYADRGPPAFL